YSQQTQPLSFPNRDSQRVSGGSQAPPPVSPAGTPRTKDQASRGSTTPSTASPAHPSPAVPKERERERERMVATAPADSDRVETGEDLASTIAVQPDSARQRRERERERADTLESMKEQLNKKERERERERVAEEDVLTPEGLASDLGSAATVVERRSRGGVPDWFKSDKEGEGERERGKEERPAPSMDRMRRAPFRPKARRNLGDKERDWMNAGDRDKEEPLAVLEREPGADMPKSRRGRMSMKPFPQDRPRMAMPGRGPPMDTPQPPASQGAQYRDHPKVKYHLRAHLRDVRNLEWVRYDPSAPTLGPATHTPHQGHRGQGPTDASRAVYRLASGSADCSIKIWSHKPSPATPGSEREAPPLVDPLCTLRGHKSMVSAMGSCYFAPTPSAPTPTLSAGLGVLVSGDVDGCVRMWSVPSTDTMYAEYGGVTVHGLPRDNPSALSLSDGAAVWGVACVQGDGDSVTVVVAGCDRVGEIRLTKSDLLKGAAEGGVLSGGLEWTRESRLVVPSPLLSGLPGSVSLASPCVTCATYIGGSKVVFGLRADPSDPGVSCALVYDVRTHAVVQVLTTGVGTLSPRGDAHVCAVVVDDTTDTETEGERDILRVCLGVADGRVVVYRRESAEEAFTLHYQIMAHASGVQSLSVLPDKHILTAAGDRSVRLWTEEEPKGDNPPQCHMVSDTSLHRESTSGAIGALVKHPQFAKGRPRERCLVSGGTDGIINVLVI
ncbi:hypothetical protein KIPB_003345, partial [Kipferlia bialata]